MTVFQFMLLGLGTGAMYALSSLGLIVVHRGSGVVNFAAGAFGMVGGFVYWVLRDENHIPLGVAMTAGTAVSALLGMATYRFVMRPLQATSQIARVVATLAVLIAIEAAVGLRTSPDVKVVQPIFPTGYLSIFGAAVGTDYVFLLGIGIVIAGGAWAVYRYSMFGLATSAVSENPDALAGLGRSPDWIAGINWAIGGAISGIATILLIPTIGLQISTATDLVIPAIASAVLARFRSIPAGFAAGLVIGVIESEVGRWVNIGGAAEAVPFVVIVLFLVAKGQTMSARSFVAERLPRVGTGQLRPGRIAVLLILAGCVIYWALPVVWVSAVTATMTSAIMIFSVVVVMGYGGQISLAQSAMGLLGALFAARLMTAGLPFWPGCLLAVAASAAVGIVVGIPAVRVRGMGLAIVTLGVAVVIVDVLLANTSLAGGSDGISVPTPSLFGVSLDGLLYPRRFALLVLVALCLVGICISNLRRSRAGRRLLAVRANERAAAALGIRVAETKLAGFAWAAAIAAVGGILAQFGTSNVVFSGASVFDSINLVAYAVVGGVGFLAGPEIGGWLAVGGIGAEIFVSIFHTNGDQWIAFAGGILLLLNIVKLPDGIAALMIAQVRWVAQRTKPIRWVVSKSRTRSSVLPVAGEATGSASTRPEGIGEVALEVSGLTVELGGIRAVNDLSLTISRGEILGVIGANGAGKTTLVDALSGFVRLASGTVKLDGVDVVGWSAQALANAGISRSFQTLELFEDLSVEENLLIACDRQDRKAWFSAIVRAGHSRLSQSALVALKDFDLEEQLDATPRQLSYSTRHLLAIARAVASSPSVLLLDEPAAGLDEAERVELERLIKSLARNYGMAILLIDHDVRLVTSVADRMLGMVSGRGIAYGTPDEVKADPNVVASYLGESVSAEVA